MSRKHNNKHQDKPAGGHISPLEGAIHALYPEFDQVRQALHCGMNQVIGGYLAQPIFIRDEHNGTYTIRGYCVLKEHQCQYTAPELRERSVCYVCPEYIQQEQEWIKKEENRHA